MNQHETYDQTCERYLAAPDVSFWMKDAIKALRNRDPVDALNDAEELHRLMARRWNEQIATDNRRRRRRAIGRLAGKLDLV
tara:strand:+ start:2236 stop:2478 length:243 start_codon:yes stop_codon:yes gene_type:complete